MRPFIGALASAALGVAIGAFVARAGEAALMLILAFGGFVVHADPEPHAIAWMLGAHAAAGAISGFFLAAAVRALSASRALRRRAFWVLGSAAVWTLAGAFVLFLAPQWAAVPLVREGGPWLAAIVALVGAILVLLAVRPR